MVFRKVFKSGDNIMVKRLLAITFIYICTTVGWFILAGTVLIRTETFDTKLRGEVSKLWGAEQIQNAPAVYLKSTGKHKDGEEFRHDEYIPLEASDINVDIDLEHRKKGLQWYSTYRVDFSGKYRIKNDSIEPREMLVSFTLPAKGAVYDNFRFLVGNKQIENIGLQSGRITQMISLAAGQSEEIEIAYGSQGQEQWSYSFGENVSQVKNFSLVVNTDFEEIDFSKNSISPTNKEQLNNGWKLAWQYDNLLTGVKIGLVMPQKLNPGPWVGKVTAAAPVSLFLYFFLLVVVTMVKKIKIHSINYFFIGAAFFSFHLLLAYLVDHISIHLAFWICSAVSIFLVVSYMRLVVGLRFAFFEIALTQLVYLVFFSYTFFFKSYTGLAITILCICTLFFTMQFTGKVDWAKVFEKTNHAGSNVPGK